MSKWKFKATLVKDDKRTGYKAGMKFDPKGFYRNGENVVLIVARGLHRLNVEDTTVVVQLGNTRDVIGLEFPVDSVKVDVMRDFAKPRPGVKWGVWMEKEGDLPEGWCNSYGCRQNEMFHRTDNPEDADTYDFESDAFERSREFNGLGYKCEERRLP